MSRQFYGPYHKNKTPIKVQAPKYHNWTTEKFQRSVAGNVYDTHSYKHIKISLVDWDMVQRGLAAVFLILSLLAFGGLLAMSADSMSIPQPSQAITTTVVV